MNNETKNNLAGDEGVIPPKNRSNNSYGPLVGSIIIVLVVILGGIYYFKSAQKDMRPVFINNNIKDDDASLDDNGKEIEPVNIEARTELIL